MKKSTLLATYLLIFIAMIGFVFFQKNDDSGLTGNAVFSPPASLKECTDQNIVSLWENIFIESSSGIIINKTCSEDNKTYNFKAYKIKNNKELYILAGLKDLELVLNTTSISGKVINYLDNYLNSTVVESMDNGFSTTLVGPGYFVGIASRNINSKTEAEEAYNNYFKTASNGLEEMTPSFDNFVYFANNSEGAYVYKNYSIDQFIFVLREGCTPNWIQVNTTCINDNKTKWFNDTNVCGNITGRPANITYSCDSEGNGIIGTTITAVNINTTNLKVYINGSELNLSQVYTSTKLVEIKDGTTTLIKFNWNFVNPLDLEGITIKKQSSGSDFGYVIVNGLEVNKTIYIDKKMANSTDLCVINSSTANIGDFSEFCDDEDESFLNCPEESHGLNCVLVNNNATFEVSGLMHSAVKELPLCTSNWTCSNWTSCINSSRKRTCSDNNNCPIYTKKPATIQSCNISFANDNSNNLSVSTNTVLTDTTTGTATSQNDNSKNMFWVYLLIGILVLFAIILGIVLLIKKKNETDQPTMSDQLKPYLNNSQMPPQNPQVKPQPIPPVQPQQTQTPIQPQIPPAQPRVPPQNPSNNFPPRDPRTGLPLK